MDILGSLGSASGDVGYVKCSRKGCEAEAVFEVLWNNPKVHAPERLKAWVACGEHRVFLEDFLRAREFWKVTVPLGASGSDAGLRGGLEA